MFGDRSGHARRNTQFGFGRDRTYVDDHAQILPGADPATLRAMLYHRDAFLPARRDDGFETIKIASIAIIHMTHVTFVCTAYDA